MLSLNQRMSQTQKLSPQQIQYQKLLQLNNLALEQRIKAELEINPLLEEVPAEDLEPRQDEVDEFQQDEEVPKEETSQEETPEVEAANEFEVEDYMNSTDADGSEAYNPSAGEKDLIQILTPSRKSLTEHLLDQIYELNINDEEALLGEMIIGSLDDEGYFNQDMEKLLSDLRLFESVDISPDDAEKVLKLIQTMDPVGIASRNLQECLLVQLKYVDLDPYYSYLAEMVLQSHFEEFLNKKYDSIQKDLNLSRESLKAVLDLIQKLNPHPGEGQIESPEANQITPDFIIEKVDDDYILSLNEKGMPSVTYSKTYLEMMNKDNRKRKISEREKETHVFLREKFESAKWFIASIEQRRNTLLKIMRSIFEKQYEFFELGPRALKPMIYRDVADEVMMDISTISRVVNGKYVQSPVGIHELKYFFSEGLSTDGGPEISNKHIKELIKEICSSEPKDAPYSDDRIATMLKEEGIHIARRTIAKYREQLRIPVARLRKTL